MDYFLIVRFFNLNIKEDLDFFFFSNEEILEIFFHHNDIYQHF